MSHFNDAKYKALLKGLDCLVVPLSALERTKRIDAEYFHKRHVHTVQLLKDCNTQSVIQCADISDGNHFSIAESFVQKGIPYYRGQDVVGNFFVEQADPVHITEDAFLEPWMSRSHLQKGDVLLTIIGTIGELSVVSDSALATCSCKLAILRPRDIAPEYLATFLRCSHGRSQIERLTRGAVQMGVLLEDMDQLKVVRLSESLEKRIAQQVRNAKAGFEQSKACLAAAESAFPNALGLADWKPPLRLTSVRRFSDVRARERIDAEHYQEEFYAATRKLKEAGASRFVAMDDLLLTLTNGHTPLHHDLTIGDVPFLCAEHVSNYEVHYNSDKRILLAHHRTELARTALHNGDVLLTIKGRIGNAALVENLPGLANINQDVALLRLNSTLPTWYVLAFINSLFGRLQVQQLSTGGINPFLGLANVRKLQIPELAPAQMKRIAKDTNELIRVARIDQERATRYLESAKRAVELAIEKNETAALEHLNGLC